MAGFCDLLAQGFILQKAKTFLRVSDHKRRLIAEKAPGGGSRC